ncbi:holo-ACP synthase [Corynebacterium aquilae]|uniref:Holo-[acyl-carrier-protein] synthase n=1 Tax=Corynebacterium aquilae DSM 44791 TaxID=1431546 RepID=A0A1L7CHI0_9CORY|nr:holo-ACP synthase [Corynebacterium aquilae]APT85304.1 hypothetical protein CAQU_09745 [Corynebacterium aquilae DSM 44791]
MHPPHPLIPALGVDICHIPSINTQLAQPGSRFTDILSGIERRHLAKRPEARRAEFVAGRFAAKEAIIKAWEQALVGQPPVLAKEAVDFSEISVESDAYGRLVVRLGGSIAQSFAASCPKCRIQVSISHDGEYAFAQALVVGV